MNQTHGLPADLTHHIPAELLLASVRDDAGALSSCSSCATHGPPSLLIPHLYEPLHLSGSAQLDPLVSAARASPPRAP